MSLKITPCKGCTERFTACYDRCPKDARGEYGYKAWKEDYNKQKAAEREYKLSRREDWMRSEERSYGQDRYVTVKNRRRGVTINGRK